MDTCSDWRYRRHFQDASSMTHQKWRRNTIMSLLSGSRYHYAGNYDQRRRGHDTDTLNHNAFNRITKMVVLSGCVKVTYFSRIFPTTSSLIFVFCSSFKFHRDFFFFNIGFIYFSCWTKFIPRYFIVTPPPPGFVDKFILLAVYFCSTFRNIPDGVVYTTIANV